MSLFKKYFSELALALVILGVLIFSLSNLTTKPKIWTDEGLNIELARNFLSYGKLNVMVAPNVFFDAPFLLQATGYPLTVPLALFFKLFGIGPWQARLYALLWLISFLIVVFWFIKKIFGAKHAFLTVSLLATFAPFYGNGRCVTGEVAGSIFLLLSLYFILYRNRIFLGGFLLGLAVVTKPSIYLLSALAMLAVFLIERQNFWKKAVKFISGLAPAMIFWIFFSLPDYFSSAPWLKIISYYQQPFGRMSLINSVIANLINWLHSPTLIYFSILFLIILGAIFWEKKFLRTNRSLLLFTIIFIGLSTVYFLKSPGWLRYLAAAQFLIFIVFGPALDAIIDKLKISQADFFATNKSLIFYGSMGFLILVQLVYLATAAKLPYSTASTGAISFLNQQVKDKTVGIVNAPEISGLILVGKRYQIITVFVGLPVIGQDFLASEPSRWPDLLVVEPNDAILILHKENVNKFYNLLYANGGYNVYGRK